ncbi:RxLR effector protein [Phytophthora megakarya]|uniref:RxLR effector protein n=1 Tax=Phytophthora megakarya TaxID=4795 RepID=A0A225W066_9STRA|nr:RxLR effector protein [Phytophthora megakarya]
MASPRRITWQIFVVLLTAIVSSKAAPLDQAKVMGEIPRLLIARSPDVGQKTAATTRFLRGTFADVTTDEMNNEERSYILNKFVHKPAINAALTISLWLKDSPAKVLSRFRQRGISMKENNLLPWLEYVLKYRAKVGYTSADDAYVIKTLKQVIPDIQLPILFQAMEKKATLRNFAKELKSVS